MQIGSLVQYRYYYDGSNHGYGVIIDAHHHRPDRLYFFVCWMVGTNDYGKKLENTWYHPDRLEVLCK